VCIIISLKICCQNICWAFLFYFLSPHVFFFLLIIVIFGKFLFSSPHFKFNMSHIFAFYCFYSFYSTSLHVLLSSSIFVVSCALYCFSFISIQYVFSYTSLHLFLPFILVVHLGLSVLLLLMSLMC
jgi:hypothetical protein